MSHTKKIGLALLLSFILLFINTVPLLALALPPEEIPQAIANYIEERKEATAGLALAVFQADESIYQQYYGYADVENMLPVDEETVFEWGSVTKVLTWVSVMQLVEEGQLDLKEDIRTYLPQGFLRKLRYSEPITMLHLMNHQAGFQEVIFADEYALAEDVPELAAALRLSEPAQVYPPGSVTAYSNYGAALAGYIVECISGLPFYEYVNKHIFHVLDMKHSSIKPGWSDKPWLAAKREETKSYSYYENEKESYGNLLVHIALYPAGSCAGTLNDFLTFALEFTRAETKLFKKQATMEALISPSLFYTGTDISRIHHGLWTLDYGKKLLGHGGNTQGFSSAFWFDPQSKTGLVVMTNEASETSYNYGLPELVYGVPEIDIMPGEDISGIYYSKRGFAEGFARIFSYSSQLLPIQKSKEEGKFKVSLIDFDIYSLGNGLYRQDSHNGLANNFYKIPGENLLESYTTDYEKLSKIALLVPAFLILASLLVFLYSIINSLLVLVKKFRRERFSCYATGNNLALLASMTISAIFFYLWLFIDSYAYEKVRIICLLLMLAMLFVAANFLYQLIGCLERKNKRGDMLKAALSILPLLTALFFQTYRFWV